MKYRLTCTTLTCIIIIAIINILIRGKEIHAHALVLLLRKGAFLFTVKLVKFFAEYMGTFSSLMCRLYFQRSTNRKRNKERNVFCNSILELPVSRVGLQCPAFEISLELFVVYF